jgi:hypothetical protein
MKGLKDMLRTIAIQAVGYSLWVALDQSIREIVKRRFRRHDHQEQNQ